MSSCPATRQLCPLQLTVGWGCQGPAASTEVRICAKGLWGGGGLGPITALPVDGCLDAEWGDSAAVPVTNGANPVALDGDNE